MTKTHTPTGRPRWTAAQRKKFSATMAEKRRRKSIAKIMQKGKAVYDHHEAAVQAVAAAIIPPEFIVYKGWLYRIQEEAKVIG